MAARLPIVIGPDGLAQQLQDADTLPGDVLPVTKVASAQFTVASNVLTATALYGVSGITRISAGRYRANFSVAQPDTKYNPRSDCAEPSTTAPKFSRIGTRTTTYVEILISQVSLVGGILGLSAADAPEVFFDVERIT